MKKCPECGNPSYDGAPVCGNCGYKFPKSKSIVPKGEDIFKKEPKKEPKKEKPSDEESILEIVKEKKLIIGAILIITLIVVCGIFLTGSSNTSSTVTSSATQTYESDSFSFTYPATWQKINATDEEHPDAVFFKSGNVTIEYYNVTTSASSLKEINQNRITHGQGVGASVTLLETITIEERNASNIIFENADGDYTRYVSMFSDGKLYVFRVIGDSVNSITSDDINGAINSSKIL